MSQPHLAFNGACRPSVVVCGVAGSDALTLLKLLIPIIIPIILLILLNTTLVNKTLVI